MEWHWFRRPRGEDAGTTNLCYNAVDRHVVGERATDPALTAGSPLDFAGLLETVAALAGAFRGLGVDEQGPVVVVLADPRDELLSVLAAARVGAPAVLPGPGPAGSDVAGLVDAHRPRLLVTDREVAYGAHAPAARLVRGIDPVDQAHDLPWGVALDAGRTDPAGCAAVDPRATALVVGRPVAVLAAVELAEEPGPTLAALVRGEPVER